MKVRPIHDRVLVKPDEARKRTTGGIIIPDTVTERPKAGRVRGIGEEATIVKANDRIVFSQNAGVDITIDGEGLLLMREADIIGIEEEGDMDATVKE